MNAFLEIWTNVCLAFAFALFVAWGGIVLFLHGRAWWRQVCAFLRRQPVWAHGFLVFFVLCLWLYGSVKTETTRVMRQARQMRHRQVLKVQWDLVERMEHLES